jgi:hypothetical protein
MSYELQQKSNEGTTFGIISLFAWFIPILGVILSVIGIAKSNRNDDTLGLVLSVIGLILAAGNWILGAMSFMQ